MAKTLNKTERAADSLENQLQNDVLSLLGSFFTPNPAVTVPIAGVCIGAFFALGI